MRWELLGRQKNIENEVSYRSQNFDLFSAHILRKIYYSAFKDSFIFNRFFHNTRPKKFKFVFSYCIYSNAMGKTQLTKNFENEATIVEFKTEIHQFSGTFTNFKTLLKFKFFQGAWVLGY